MSLSFYNIIALDADSFPAAQTLARNSGDEGRAFTLSNDARGNPVLLAEDGRVVTMVEGGAHNRVSMVGSTDSFSLYGAGELAGGVQALVRGEKIASVTMYPVINEGEAFQLQNSFNELEISDRNSPWRDVTDYVRLHALEQTERGVVETGNMQVGAPGTTDTFLLDGDYLRDALRLGRRQQPGVLEAQLRARMADLHEKGLTAEREVFQSLTLDYANKVRDLRARFEVFKEAMRSVYEKEYTDFTLSTTKLDTHKLNGTKV